ncbi:MAG: hypothetical protein MK132_24460 [Lentisphaerales bacterium]|nr:hypothetical protein [Lentisphaerales bacterium]
MTLSPKFAEAPTKSFPNAFGVALNGVLFEPSTAEFWRGDRNWNQEAINGRDQRLLGLDDNYARSVRHLFSGIDPIPPTKNNSDI